MQTHMSFSVGNKTSYFSKKSGKHLEREFMNLRFIDSFGFMASSLSQLVIDLKAGGIAKFKKVAQEFGSDTEFMTKKQFIHTVSWMDTISLLLIQSR